MDDDAVRFEISARRHLARAMRSLAAGIEQGAVPLSPRAWELIQEFFRECLPPERPADPPTTAPPSEAA